MENKRERRKVLLGYGDSDGSEGENGEVGV